MKKSQIIAIATVSALALAIAAWMVLPPSPAKGGRGAGGEGIERAAKPRYQCPMHPQIVRDEPGDCPICHMHLQKMEDADAAAPAPAPAAASKAGHVIVKYRNPMNPKVFSDKPTKDSMGMDYIPVYADEMEDAGDGQVPDHAAFTLPDYRRQLIGVRSETAKREDIIKTLRLPGRIGQDRGVVLAQALEMDGGVVKAGLRAEVLVQGGDPVPARIVQVDRSLDAYSRTYGVLLTLLAPADALMRPGVYVDVRVELKLANGVAVPKAAVMDTGDQQWLFVQKDGGRFEPRAVRLGPEGDDLVEVRQGVAEGEQVVTSANFLIDSESRFKAAAASFGSSGGGHD